MRQISRSATLAAPVERVWAVLADFGALSSWASNVDHSCLLEHGSCLLEHGDHGPSVGTTRRVQVGRNTLVERITEIAGNATLAYDIEGLPRRVRRLTNRWTLTPAGPGVTAVTLTTTVEIGTHPLTRIAEHALCRYLATQSDAMLNGLAARVEGSP